MLSAIEEGGHTRGMTERMRELEAREDVLKGLLAQEPADIPDIHPNVSGIYRKKVERLTEALNTPEDRNEAAEAIRALVEKITLRPGPNRGEIDATLHGELGTILGWIEAQALGKTRKRETPAAFATGVSVSVVAGHATISNCFSEQRLAQPMLVADGIQLGSLRIFAMFSRAVPTFRSFTLQFSSSLRRRSKVNSILVGPAASNRN